MKRIYSLTLALLLIFPSLALGAEGFPRTLAGITLGDNMDQYADLCKGGISTPMPDAPFLSEIHIDPDSIPGIRGGSITYTNSTPYKKVVRIKLKFHERRQDLFEELLERYQKAYKKPDSYRGDSFRNVIAWQWNFTQDKEQIGLLLMWSRERQLRPGVSIKMTLDSLVDAEYKAFRARNRKMNKGSRDGKEGPSRIKNLDEFVPR
jgi:hypothetical protein